MTNHRSSNNYYHQGRATKANSLSLKKSDKQREVKSREAKYCKNFLRRAVQDVNFNFCSKSVHKNHRLNGAYPSMYSTHIHTCIRTWVCVCMCEHIPNISHLFWLLLSTFATILAVRMVSLRIVSRISYFPIFTVFGNRMWTGRLRVCSSSRRKFCINILDITQQLLQQQQQQRR